MPSPSSGNADLEAGTVTEFEPLPGPAIDVVMVSQNR